MRGGRGRPFHGYELGGAGNGSRRPGRDTGRDRRGQGSDGQGSDRYEYRQPGGEQASGGTGSGRRRRYAGCAGFRKRYYAAAGQTFGDGRRPYGDFREGEGHSAGHRPEGHSCRR